MNKPIVFMFLVSEISILPHGKRTIQSSFDVSEVDTPIGSDFIIEV
jgi:hypothetical protein